MIRVYTQTDGYYTIRFSSYDQPAIFVEDLTEREVEWYRKQWNVPQHEVTYAG